MHEMTLCESLLEVIEEQARIQSFTRVRRVRLEVGPFSGVEIEALRFAFDVVVKDTGVEGAALEIIEVEGKGRCLDCNKTVMIGDRLSTCPECSGTNVRVTGGYELRIKELEVE
jgi:hydrogenase nickel incorporation protein HypA/HybF